MNERSSELSSPLVTVYIPSHNYGKYLSDAIESVLHQTMDDWELILIDDNSSDNTWQIMSLYKGDTRISVFQTGGIGLPSVCNFALGHARGKYIIRLDGDDVFDENILLVLANVLEKESDVGFTFPGYYLVDDFGEIYAQERRRSSRNNRLMDMPPNGACTMVRKSALQEVGGYREDLGAQDGMDLWGKLKNRCKSRSVNIPLFYYRRHDTNLTTKVDRILFARRQIKKDLIQEKLDSLRPIVAVIPCRRNYDFEIDLWKQEINGHSLLQRDIDVCLGSNMFDYVVVASDNPEAKEVVDSYTDQRLRYFARDPRDTTRTSSILNSLEKMISEVDAEFCGTTVMRYLQTPFVTPDTLEEAITTLAFSQASSAFAIEEINNTLFKRTPKGLEQINKLSELAGDFDAIYRDSMTCFAVRNSNIAAGSLTGSMVASFIVSSAECFFIDSDEKLRVARMMASEMS